MAGEAEQDGALQPWDQQPGESSLWYGRFKSFLGMGPTRSMLRLYREVCNKPKACGIGNWHYSAREWRWRERAHAWDVRQRELIALSERNLRLSLRESRIGVTEEALEVIRGALDRAEIAEVDRDQAREWLPQLCVFLRDMLVVQRQEFEHDFSADDPANAVAITADDLRAAQRAMEEQERRLEPGAGRERRVVGEGPQASIEPPHGKRWRHANDSTFLVCTGPDSELLLDLAALRAVRAATGLRFQRLLSATQRKLSRALTRQRSFGHPIEYIHMALHASAAGLELADGPVDGNWLSERLGGVRVLLLASCESDSIGDWLRVVPYVITLNEEIGHEDAAALTQHFWHRIGSGLEPGEALDGALEQCPPAVGEYVVRHW